MEGESKSFEGLSTITIPSGKELKKLAFYCSKHGDITEASIKMNTERIDIRGNKVVDRNVYCIACLNELLKRFQDTGEIGKVALVPVIGDKKPGSQPELDFGEDDK